MSNKNRDYEKYIDLMWTTLDYWKGMAAYHKEEAEYYKGIVKEAVENGRKTASLKLLRKIAKELDCSVLDFIEED